MKTSSWHAALAVVAFLQTPSHVDFLIYRKIGKMPVLAVEVDGFHYHKPGTPQYERDLKKNHIFQLYNIPFLRFPTNGSGEREKIVEFLEMYKANNHF